MSNYSLFIQELMVYRESSPFCTDLTCTSWTHQILLLRLPCTIRGSMLPSGLSALEREMRQTDPVGTGESCKKMEAFRFSRIAATMWVVAPVPLYRRD